MNNLPLAVLLLCLAAAPLAAEEKTENYPQGGKHLVYAVDAKGEKNGSYREFFRNGKPKVQATYRHGSLTGAYKEFDAKGKPRVSAAYREGKLHGPRQEFSEGRLVRDELWSGGELLVPQSATLLAAQLRAIQTLPVKTVGIVPAATASVKAVVNNPQLQSQREAALRVLMSYRCVCGLPYADLMLDREYIAHDEAASALLTRIDKLTHTPENPGWPEEEFQFALKGTHSSNLFSASSPVESVKSYMDDSDPGNIDRLGHRRWCLNPKMARTGFGCGGKYGAMWSFDSSRKEVPDYAFVAFPPRGLVPASIVKEKMAWSVSLNPEKYQPPAQDGVKVKIVPVRFQPRQGALQKGTQSLELNYFRVNLDPYGIPNCIIFRPVGVQIAAGASYWVEIRGLKTRSGEAAAIEYLVSFAAL